MLISVWPLESSVWQALLPFIALYEHNLLHWVIFVLLYICHVHICHIFVGLMQSMEVKSVRWNLQKSNWYGRERYHHTVCEPVYDGVNVTRSVLQIESFLVLSLLTLFISCPRCDWLMFFNCSRDIIGWHSELHTALKQTPLSLHEFPVCL